MRSDFVLANWLPLNRGPSTYHFSPLPTFHQLVSWSVKRSPRRSKPITVQKRETRSEDRGGWTGMEIDVDRDPLGAPAYHPRALLSVWLDGFMTGVRSSRKLEAACRDQIPYLWLTGCQQPDHNTLWRFYQAHRQFMRWLLKCLPCGIIVTGIDDWIVKLADVA